MSTSTENYGESTRKDLGCLFGLGVGICLLLFFGSFTLAVSSYFSLTIELWNKEWWVFMVLALICIFGPSMFFSHKWGKQNW